MQYRAALAAAFVAALGAALGVGLASCQQTDAQTDYRSTPLGRDVHRICNAVELSGVDREPTNRQLFIAQWLGANIESVDGRNFLVSLARVEGEAKVKVLEDQARRVGLSGCPLAAEWKPKP
jgi:hypothetical protein